MSEKYDVNPEKGQFLEEMGDIIGKKITRVKKIKWNTVGVKIEGDWLPAEVRKPQTLPYWGHKRGIKAENGFYLPTVDNPVPDAFTGATPNGNFLLKTRANDKTLSVIKVFLEINQPLDWNEYYTLNKYPDDPYYKESQQPALVYSATVDLSKKKQKERNSK